ncbi:two-component sensor histidine kinase [Croceicoccus estronivorus]|uniref:sensor histidine kinase n=1 Tax=Croceicoccus estronivorus TaxID=1172626 RepID=UPI00083443B0|nr:ATP-binding protein [Croceicoccus estronivorus]OCC23855.1 two-component sensor histidine kinase [Croceicoccus estronivorus]
MRLWPRSLLGQMLLSVALALLVAQGLSGVLLWRAEQQRRETAVLNAIAFRVIGGTEADGDRDRGRFVEHQPPGLRRLRLERSGTLPIGPDEVRQPKREAALAAILAEQGVNPADLVVVERPLDKDPFLARRIEHWRKFGASPDNWRRTLLIAALQEQPGADWIVARVALPDKPPRATGSLLAQTLLLYIILVGLLALLLRRITRPLAALTTQVDHFARTREADGQLEPHGPEDISRLIAAHNAMEDRITALLGEKDVMLGAIGHDLKTPLAGLRIRIESVTDETERRKMAATVEDITRTLDDILSLARVGRPSDPLQKTELSALVASVVEDFEDMGENAELGDTTRIVLSIRETWLRRAMRNLISNALRYGGNALVTLSKEGNEAVIRIVDDGPGIPDGEIAGLFEPFARGEPSRNRATGGAGLGLTLARAIAEQHGGRLLLANRPEGGLQAELRLPLG